MNSEVLATLIFLAAIILGKLKLTTYLNNIYIIVVATMIVFGKH